jgi:hypothetical protein
MFRLWFGLLVRSFRARRGLLVENLVLGQQLMVLKREPPRHHLWVSGEVYDPFAQQPSNDSCGSRIKQKTTKQQNKVKTVPERENQKPKAEFR